MKLLYKLYNWNFSKTLQPATLGSCTAQQLKEDIDLHIWKDDIKRVMVCGDESQDNITLEKDILEKIKTLEETLAPFHLFKHGYEFREWVNCGPRVGSLFLIRYLRKLSQNEKLISSINGENQIYVIIRVDDKVEGDAEYLESLWSTLYTPPPVKR